MSRHTTTIPRSSIFTLEDGTWVVQRGVDRVQELLTRQDRVFSSLDMSFEITDNELDALCDKGIIEQYDDFFVWLKRDLAEASLHENSLGVTTYYYVQTDLSSDQAPIVQSRLANTGLANRYEVSTRSGKIIIMCLYGEPFSLFSSAEDAQILLIPVLQDLAPDLTIKSVRFNTGDILPVWAESRPASPTTPPLIRRLAPELRAKNVVCIDQDHRTHEIVGQICDELDVEIASAHVGKEGMTLIQDSDPALIIMDLTLPDLHGYEIVAFVRNNPELAHIPIIIVSQLNTDTDRAFAFTIAKVKDYIPKPFTVKEIRRQVWQILNQRSV